MEPAPPGAFFLGPNTDANITAAPAARGVLRTGVETGGHGSRLADTLERLAVRPLEDQDLVGAIERRPPVRSGHVQGEHQNHESQERHDPAELLHAFNLPLTLGR